MEQELSSCCAQTPTADAPLDVRDVSPIAPADDNAHAAHGEPAAASEDAAKEDAPYLDEVTERERPAELSFDAKLERASTLLHHNRAYRPAFRAIIRRCDGSVCPLDELEELVGALPGYEKLKQPPYFPIHWLAEAYALEELYLDAEGAAHTADELAGLSEDEFDDLVTAFAYRTTEVGRAVAEQFAPQKKTARLLEDEPERYDLYIELLEFLEETRTFAQIGTLLRDRPIPASPLAENASPKPSVLVDKLEEAGAIAFDGGWHITSEGKELLDSIRRE